MNNECRTMNESGLPSIHYSSFCIHHFFFITFWKKQQTLRV